MPPRATSRPNARASSRDGDWDISRRNLPDFVNLPPLQGTPSSRRQYTYGAEAEPPPSRPGRGLRKGQVVDLGRAVKNALSRQEAEEAVGPSPSRGRQSKSFDAADEDELASDDPKFRQAAERSTAPIAETGPTGSLTQLRSAQTQFNDSSDLDDVRSFGIESDIYGDATIALTPAVPPAQATKAAAPPQQPSSKLLPHPRTINSSAQEDPKGLNEHSFMSHAATNEGRAARSGMRSRATNFVSLPRKRSIEVRHGDELQEHENEDDARHVASQALLGHQGKANGTAPEQPMRDSSKQATRTTQDEHILKPKGTTGGNAVFRPGRIIRQGYQPGKHSEGADGFPQRDISHTATNSQRESRGYQNTSLNKHRSSFFTRPSTLSHIISPFSKRRQQYASDHSEMDDAIQRDIQESEDGLSREDRRTSRGASTQIGEERRWGNLKPLWRRDKQGAEKVRLVTTDDANNFTPSRATSPFHFSDGLQAVIRLTGTAAESWLSFIQVMRHGVLGNLTISALKILPYVLAAILAGIAVAPFLGGAFESASSHLSTLSYESPSLPSTHGLARWVRGWIPSVSWYSPTPWDNLSSFWDMESTGKGSIEELFAVNEKRLATLAQALKLHDDSLKKLAGIVPDVVHMELSTDGKPVVKQGFWHAIRDLIREDDGIVTLERKGKEYELASERQWRAISRGLDRDPNFALKWNHSASELEKRVTNKMANSWDQWVKNNNGIVAKMLGSELDKIYAAGSDGDFDRRLSNIVQKQLEDSERKGVLVTREEFIRHLQNEFSAHRAEIRAELNELRPQLEKFMQESVEMAVKDMSRGMAESDIVRLVDKLVRKAIADVNLNAMAKGKIHEHWDSQLKHEVNYFGLAAGAVAHASSSPTYDPDHRGVASDKHPRGSVQKPLPPSGALTPWLDEGDCWCGTRDVNRRGNPLDTVLNVMLGYTIIPENIVVEHILPGATTKPDARPRDIEIFARVADTDVRERMGDFAATHFPDDPSDWDYKPAAFGRDFVKIGQMRYEGAELHDGIYVHQLSPELRDLGVETDQVIVRAVSNYGDPNQICFYRVRLYGARSEPELDGHETRGSSVLQSVQAAARFTTLKLARLLFT